MLSLERHSLLALSGRGREEAEENHTDPNAEPAPEELN